MRLLLIAIAWLFTAAAALAGADQQSPVSTSSVAEMLQRRQEHPLREQLAKEGRWNEIRQMDEEQLRRQRMQTKQTLTKMNAELAREGTVDTPVNGDGVLSFCAPVRAPTRLETLKTKQDSTAARTDTRNVR